MALSTQDILLKHVCPGVGDVIALIMFGSPLKAVLEVNRKKCLGDLNALPFIAMAVNCTAWIIYGFLTRDFYIYFGNMPGLLFGMYFCLICYKFSKEQAQDMLRNIYLGSCCLLFTIGLVQLAGNMNLTASKTLWGSTCVAVLGVYYTAPLSSLAKVIAQKDSSSLHWPLCLMNIINGMLWFAYGLALKDYFVALPNGIGAAFNVICLAFCFIFPAKNRSRLAGQANVTANWGALRLQSIRRPPTDAIRSSSSDSRRDVSAAGLGAGAAASGGFFDLTQFRWRSGGSFRLGSRIMSHRQLLSRLNTQQLPEVATTADGLRDGSRCAVDGDALAHDALEKDVESGAVKRDSSVIGGDVFASNCVDSSSSSSRVDVLAVVPGTEPTGSNSTAL